VLVLVVAGAILPCSRADDALPADANKLCPVMEDQPTKATIFLDYQGRRVYFCCNKCPQKFQREPEKYLANLSGARSATTAPVLSTTPSDGATSSAFSAPIWQLAGRLHVVVVHFPIALILLAGVLELARFRKPQMTDAAYLCLVLGALAAALAAALGWIDAINTFNVVTAPRALSLHRWTGVTLAGLAVALAWIATMNRYKVRPIVPRSLRVGVIASALLVAVVGHFGGTLSYGEDYYTAVFKTGAKEQVATAVSVAPAKTLATIPASAPTTTLASSRSVPSDAMQVFLFGTAREARMARILERLRSSPPAPTPPDVGDAPVNNDIDRFIVAKWRSANLDSATNPPPLCDDITFCRRVYLDLTGVIPTVEQSQKFADDSSPDKRSKLIDELLSREAEYAAHWTPFFEEAIASGPAQASMGLRGNYQAWIIDSFKKNTPWDVMFAQLVDPTEPGYVKKETQNINGNIVHNQYVKSDTHVDTLQTAANIGQFFLGTGMKCASCHSHFLNDEWPQKRFLGFAGLFAEKDLELIRCEKTSGQYVEAHYAFDVSGAPTNVPNSLDERLHYVARLTVDPANPRFAKTAVNRLWRRYLGLGLFEPADDFRLDSPAANPELLDWLADDFVRHGYDVKHTIRLILSSRTYQVQYDPKLEDHFDVAKRDEPRYWRSPSLRKMTAEQLIDSIRVATSQRLDDRLRLYHTNTSTSLTRTLGRPSSRVEISTARPDDVAIVQSLELLNGQEWNALVYKSPMIAELADVKEPEKVVDRVYRAVLSRLPRAEEAQLAVEFLKSEAPTTVPATEPATKPAPEEVVWIDDEIPPGATPGGSRGPESWKWVGAPEPVFSGARSHVMVSDGGANAQHLIIGATPPFELTSADDTLFTYVWVDPANPPKEIMLQFNTGDWEHRAFWGPDLIPFGSPDSATSPSRRQIDKNLPSPGTWVRLEVKAKDLGLTPSTPIVGISFDQAGGKAYWDKTGVMKQPVPDAPGVGDLLWAVFTSPEFQYIR
jgi:uncharacterized membrane protein/YHS domain-containing protein